MKSFSILLVAVSAFAVSCERHEFEGAEGTKQLSQHHSAAAEHGAGEHADKAAHEEHAEAPAKSIEKPAH